MTTEDINDTYSAAEAIDALLQNDDGELLAAMARYRTNLLELFGRAGLVEMLRTAVDAAPDVEYFSRRSRREIDPGRPEVNLRVDAKSALTSSLALQSRFISGAHDETTMTALKAAVIHEQVCIPLTTQINSALTPHWSRAKSRLQENAAVDPRLISMMLCTMFSVRIATDDSVQLDDRMCTLAFVI